MEGSTSGPVDVQYTLTDLARDPREWGGDQTERSPRLHHDARTAISHDQAVYCGEVLGQLRLAAELLPVHSDNQHNIRRVVTAA